MNLLLDTEQPGNSEQFGYDQKIHHHQVQLYNQAVMIPLHPAKS